VVVHASFDPAPAKPVHGGRGDVDGHPRRADDPAPDDKGAGLADGGGGLVLAHQARAPGYQDPAAVKAADVPADHAAHGARKVGVDRGLEDGGDQRPLGNDAAEVPHLRGAGAVGSSPHGPRREPPGVAVAAAAVAAHHATLAHGGHVEVDARRHVKAEAARHARQVQRVHVEDVLQAVRRVRQDVRAVRVARGAVEVVVLGDQLLELGLRGGGGGGGGGR